jgi:two-component system, cell cycle response regulator CtrA
MRVLLVEDDLATAANIEMMLRAECFICDTTDLGEDGLEIGKLYDYDIIILDLMPPDIEGYEVMRRLRAARVRTPILILSGLGELDHKIKGLGFGADDFLTKPFDPRELVARIQAIVRRANGHPESVIRTGKLTVNLDNRTVEVEGKPLHLTAKEYGILELLSLRKGTTLTKEMFLDHLYGGRDDPQISCARSSRRRPTVTTTSRRCGAAAMCCAIRRPKPHRARWLTPDGVFPSTCLRPS